MQKTVQKIGDIVEINQDKSICPICSYTCSTNDHYYYICENGHQFEYNVELDTIIRINDYLTVLKEMEK